MFRTAEIIKASKLPPEGVVMSRHIDYVYFLPILFVTLIGTFHMHFDLLAGDWDFWLDWKDRQYWVVITPIVAIMFCAAVQYYLWVNYRQPFGATLCIVALLTGKWITIYFAWHWWSNYAINFLMPATLLPSALILDIVLLLTRNFVVTGVVGAMTFALLFYPANWAIFAHTHQPLVADGVLLTLADYMGFTYVRTGTPEYIRIIEVGSLRTFGGHTVWISAFFSAFLSILIYFIWWYMGKGFCTAWFAVTGAKGRTTKKSDIMAMGEEGFAEGIRVGGGGKS